jgi:hypothetical protein
MDVPGQRYCVWRVFRSEPGYPLENATVCPHPLPPCGNFGYWGIGRLTHASPTPEEKNGRCQQ